MKIEQIINLWNKGKYEYLIIETLPSLNWEKKISWGTGVYKKGQKILCGREYTVEDYLKKTYKNSIFVLESFTDDSLTFKIVIEGEDK